MQSAVGLLEPTEAAQALGVQPQTLAKWRLTKSQPLPWVKFGRAVRYKRADIQKFIDTNTVTPQPAEVSG